ncbi:MAG: Fpg/Nei family DNA glycosylase [Acidimicrobiaceae bacterium]|nr:Fpg/Nei family DNA glycosylase [Acidimicrobiaceae bacterium]MYJ43583.1 Fpg/Nei family DNA glycosylase [Acidimicrobiaceae bacterium]MYJ80274.1 Fpg/Nei family DNA glycosylase [Acidimicrobiaceae bacterium]
MPELPEVAALAERLSAGFSGTPLARFEPMHPAVLKTFDPRPAAAASKALKEVGHRGKYLLLRFGEGDGEHGASDLTFVGAADPDLLGAGSDGGHEVSDLTFVVHLMQAGRLRIDANKARKPRGGMARWTFADGPALLLTEAGSERRAGVWLLAGDPGAVEPLVRLGPDAHTIGRDELARRLTAAGERVHGFLRDQSHLAGIGRLLANEILHSARISPFANTSRLDGEAVDRLHAAIATSIARGLAAEREREDMGRSQDRPSDVHHRVGEPCPACGDTVRSVEYRRYRVAYCPTCQTGGKVLADNTTSRFLK